LLKGLYSNANANAITGFARMLSKWVSYKLDLNGWKTILGDTDSLFIKLKESNELKDNLIEIEKIQLLINEAINEFVIKFLPDNLVDNHTLNMEMEKIYKVLLTLDVKKRYIGMLKYYDGKEVDKLHYMGLDSKKSNTTEISKQAQLDLALAILKEEQLNPIFEKYYTIVKNSLDINLFKLSSKLEKHQNEYKTNIPAKRSTLWSNEHLGTKFRGGTKFYILYINPNIEINTDVIAFDDSEQLNKLKNISIDKSKYLKDLYKKFNNLIRGIKEINDLNEYYYKKYTNKNKMLDEFF